VSEIVPKYHGEERKFRTDSSTRPLARATIAPIISNGFAVTTRISDLHIALEEALPTPNELHAELPVRDTEANHIAAARAAVRDILHGRDRRLLVVAGPCSIHELASALEYAGRLREFAPSVADALLLVMRVYFEKPRTRLGWKGLIYDPDLDGRGNIRQGLHDARRLLLECAKLGVPAASEILDLVTPQYYAELLTWGAIGARTTESPLHRQMASALSAPVGFKNPTSGNFQSAVDAMLAAAQPHKFPSISLDGRAIVVTTTGNPDCHLILRGGKEQPNYDSKSVAAALAALGAAGLPQRLMIDLSHGNSGGDHRRQPIVAADVAAQIAGGQSGICGVMLESHLVEGRQNIDNGRHGLTYGQSVTDACMGWDTTTGVLRQLADAVRQRQRLALRAGNSK
jgi:3-deoxy-7-phosphoheptulonate synthase